MSASAEGLEGEHGWMPYPRISETAQVCRSCGIVKRRDGLNKPCRGKVAVTLRARAADTEEEQR